MSKVIESPLELILRISASTLGTLPGALFAAACMGRFLPFDEDIRFAIAYGSVVPLWVTAMCFAFLARSGTKLWLVCLAVATAFAAAVFGLPFS